MFGKKIIIYLSRSHLFVYFNKLKNPIKLELEQSTLFNLEEFDTNWIYENLNTILSKQNFNNADATLILGRDLVFDKILETDDSVKKQAEIEEFNSKIPLSPLLITTKEYLQNDNVLLVATNKEIYTSLIDLFSKFNIDIKYVLPEVVFNNIDYTNDFLKQLFKQKDLLHYGNFLESSTDSNHKVINKKVIAITSLTFLTSIAFIYILINSLGFLNKNSEQIVSVSDTISENISNEQTQLQQTESQNVEPQITIDDIDKSKIVITIYNGNGTPGLAGDFESLLNNSEYTNTFTANASRYDYTNTIINTSNDIEDIVIEDIREILINESKSFELDNSLEGENKINITIGELQN